MTDQAKSSASPASPLPGPDLARPPASLGVVFLTLFLDLVGFSILFPLVAEMMAYYSEQGSGLMAWTMAQLDAIVPGSDAGQRGALFGGVLMGLFATLQFICAPLWGGLSDRIGRRPVLVGTVALNLLGYLLWAFADSFLLLLVSRAIGGVASGNLAVATAAVADVTDDKSRAKGMGLVGMAFGLGFVLGPAIGGTSQLWLPQAAGGSGGFGLNPFSSPALVASGLALVNLIWIWRRFGETLPAERRQPQAPRNPFALLGGDLGVGIRRSVRANLVFSVLFAAMEATLVFLALHHLGYGAEAMAGVFVTLGLTSALIQGGVVRRLAPKVGERALACAGLAAMVPAYVLLAAVAWTDSALWLWLGVVVLAVAIGCTMPSLSALASRHASSATQGQALGAYRAAGALGRAIGPFVGAIAYFSWGASAPYLIGAAGMIVPLLLVRAVPRPDAQPA